MKILQVVPLLASDGAYGGPLRVALNQVQELRRRGHQALLLSGWREPGPPPTYVDGVELNAYRAIHAVPGTGVSGLVSLSLSQALHRNLPGADVLHVHGGRDLISASAIHAGLRRNIPTMLQTHGMITPDKRSRVRAFDILLRRQVFAKASAYFSLTTSEDRSIDEAIRPGLRIHRLRNGVECPRQAVDWSRHASTVEVIYCARLNARKRPLEFITMAEMTAARGAHFTIIGPDDGELSAVMQRLAALAPGTEITYEGPLPYDAIIPRMRRAHIYVLPSMDEPFPMSLLEAMSLGMACVCTYSTGISAQLEESGAALVTDGTPAAMAQAVDDLVGNQERREEMGRRARHLAQSDFAISAVVDRLEELYRREIELTIASASVEY